MKPLNRRTMIKATGISLALPLLESMNRAGGDQPVAEPTRMVFLCNTLGLHPPSLWPSEEGSSVYLDQLKEHRADFTLFRGLAHANQNGRQAHDSEMTWLTAAAKPGMDGFRNTISVDQVAAEHLGYTTRFPSIVLGTSQQQSQSYTSGGVMIPAETSPARLFARLFLQGTPKEVRAEQRRLAQGKSILDRLKSQAQAVRRRGSRADRHLLNDYLESVRRTEKNIAAVQGWREKPKPKVAATQPQDIPDSRALIGQTNLLVDLIPLIIQTDSSRVISIMIQGLFAPVQIKGVTEQHHLLSHHGLDKSKIEQLQRVESEIVGCFGRLLGGLKATEESGTPLLRRTSVLFGSNLGNANSHSTDNLPILLAGSNFKHGGFVEFENNRNTQLSNLFLTMLTNMGIDSTSFGQSTGLLSW